MINCNISLINTDIYIQKFSILGYYQDDGFGNSIHASTDIVDIDSIFHMLSSVWHDVFCNETYYQYLPNKEFTFKKYHTLMENHKLMRNMLQCY